jgi:hypothetical protein
VSILNDLAAHERRISSQNGEDGILSAIFTAIGVTNRYFVEFGCEDATECNTAHLLKLGWQGLLMDPGGISRNPLTMVRKEFITAGNVAALFRKYGVPEAFDLLSIDIDGNDYWVWRAIPHRPRVVVIEYNAHVPPSERSSIVYDPAFKWSGTDYYGASLRALAELGTSKGYTLVYCDRTGVNAFFISTDALPQDFLPPSVEAVHRPPNFLGRGLRHRRDPVRSMVDPVAQSHQ